ncbi:MAG: hypothetical protein CSA36_02185 [Draconibacterium sp.]|nr:MAG: hypothetical protein CSA36_02185 [Draconibacterium sp.]
MLRLHNILFFVLLAISFQGFAQDEPIDPILIRVHGRMVSAADSSPVPYANIINNRTHSGTITNNDGYFTLEMLNIDSLVVTSVGYMKSVLKVPYNYSGQDVLVFKMLPVNYALSEVKVQGERRKVDLGLNTGKPTDIAPELRGDAFNESPPILAAFFNPVSYWQYYLSKREKRKREVRKAIALEKNWEMHSKNYNKEVVMMLTGMNESESDSFMVWFNAQGILPYTSTEYQVRASIIEYFNYYKIEKAMK